MCAEAAGMTFLLREINNEGDYRHLNGDTPMRQNLGRLLEGWQPTSNNWEPQTAVVKLIFYGLPSKTTRRDLTTHNVVDFLSMKLGCPCIAKVPFCCHSHSVMRDIVTVPPSERLWNNSCEIQRIWSVFCQPLCQNLEIGHWVLPKGANDARQQHLGNQKDRRGCNGRSWIIIFYWVSNNLSHNSKNHFKGVAHCDASVLEKGNESLPLFYSWLKAY